ncbi:MAG: acyltransferase domain-containing protein [Bacteroidetes bacterium]|nr:MAG: acyltransferase domain-containing protein [Bacteroidota bacterium]
MGHSMGEVAAAHIAGAIKLDDAAKVICRRSALMHTLSGKGTMMVVELTYEEATTLCASYDDLEVAVNNSPNSCVVGGLNEAIDKLEAELTEKEIFCKKVNVTVASHTFQMNPIVEQLQKEFETIMPNKSDMAVYSSVLGEQIEGENMHGAYWVSNLRNQVLFAKTVEQMLVEDHAVFVEVSPHPVLSMPIKEIFTSLGKEHECIVVGSTLRNKPEEDVLMENLAELFAVGGKIRWHKFYRAAENFVELPNYPWNRERFTIEDRSEDLTTYSLKRNDGSLGHPFLEQYIELADQQGVDVWETRLLAENIPFLNAYQANGTYQFPIAAYLEMLEAAIDEVYSKADYASHSLFVQKPVILHEGYTPILQLKVRYVNEKLSNFEIFVANLKDKAFKKRQWELVANGEIYIADTILTFPRELVKTLVRDNKETFNKKTYYGYLESYLNLKYDSEYQCVEKVWTIEGQTNKRVIAQVVPTNKIRKEQAKYKLHPLLIGSCIRTLFTILPEEMLQDYENYEFYVASIEKMYITNQEEYQSPLWAECELLPYDKANVAQEGVVGNFTLYDNLGNVIAKSYNFRLARKLKEIDHAPLYEWIWQKHSLPALASVPRETQTFLLFGQNDKLCKALVQDLQGAGHRVMLVSPKFGFKVNYDENVVESFYINPSNIHDYTAVLQTLAEESIKVSHVIYAWATQERVEVDTPIADLEYKFSFHHISILHLLQTWSAQMSDTTLHLHLLTIGAHSVEMTTRAMLAPSLWALMRATRQEYPNWVCQSIDISPTWDNTTLEQCTHHILHGHKEQEIVLRKEFCYFPRLQNVLEAHIPRNTIELQTNATYIWVGSSDQLALSFMEWLASKGVKNIVWIHQTIPTDHSTGLFNYLKKNDVHLHLIQLETLEETQVEHCLQDIRATMPAIKGVFYAPVYNQHIKLEQIQPVVLEETWTENLHGAWNFHKYTQQDALDFFVLFSSCVTWLGNNGSMVLANSALDSLAHYRASHNLPALVINWGGIANNQEHGIPHVQEFNAKLCPPFFERVFVEGVTQMGIFHLLTKPTTSFYELVQLKNKTIEETSATTPTAQSKFEEWCAIEDRHKQMQWTEQLLREKTAYIIKSVPNKVNMNTPFKSLGVDSLMLVQLRNVLEETLDIKLPVSSFFSYPSIKEYAKFLDEQLCTAMPTPVGLQASGAPTANTETDMIQMPPAPEADLKNLSLDELSQALDAELNMF